MLTPHDRERHPALEGRLQFVAIVFILGFLVLMARLWFLQVVSWRSYQYLSDSNPRRGWETIPIA